MHVRTILPHRITARRFLTHLLLFSLTMAAPVFAAELAPEFTLPGRSQPVSLASLRGKVVYLDFWASWCIPCRKSFPWMNSMQKRYGDQGLVIVAVNMDKNRELSERFLKDVPVDFKIAYDPEGTVASAYRVKGMPSSYLIDTQGQLHSSHIGFREESIADMEAIIQSLLQKH